MSDWRLTYSDSSPEGIRRHNRLAMWNMIRDFLIPIGICFMFGLGVGLMFMGLVRWI